MKFILGFIVGYLISGALIFTGDTFQEAKAVISECESTLPRNEHCALVAIPEPNQKGSRL